MRLRYFAYLEGNYYRFYCPFDVTTKTLGEIGVNKFKVGNTVNDFSFSGIKNALAREGLPCKKNVLGYWYYAKIIT